MVGRHPTQLDLTSKTSLEVETGASGSVAAEAAFTSSGPGAAERQVTSLFFFFHQQESL